MAPPTPLSRKGVGSPSWNQRGGGQHSLADDWRESLALCIICGCQIYNKQFLRYTHKTAVKYVVSGLSTALLTFILLILLLAQVYLYFKRKVKNQRVLNPGGYKAMSSIVADQWRPRNWAQMQGGGGELRGLSQWVLLWAGAQINFGDLTPYLTYDRTIYRGIGFLAVV